jgi:hypothetical protein
MDDSAQISKTLERLARAIERAEVAETAALGRIRAADARIADAQARIIDAEAQTAHADSHMLAAKAHMAAADAHMEDAEQRVARAANEKESAEDLAAETAARMEAENFDSAEYQRALYHYQQLMRHRIANPLQIIKGLAYTLLNQRGLGTKRRREMIGLIEEQAALLERLALFAPDILSEEEQELHPRPFE